MAFEMRLESLELTNFHQFEHYRVDFDEKLTVLAGNNGAGKSSVLAAASVALGVFLNHVNYGSHRDLFPSDARIDFFEMGEGIDRQGQYPVTVVARGLLGEDRKAFEWSRSLASADGKLVHASGDEFVALSRACSQRIQSGDAGLILPVIALYSTDRLWSKKHSGVDARRKTFSRQDGYKDALDARIDSDQMLSWFFKMTAQDVQRSQSIKPMGESSLFAAVRGAVERCFQAITGSSRVQVTYSFDADDLDVEYLDSKGGVQKMSMGLLSDGYRTTLSMVADIAYRMAVLNPALGEHVLETPGVVLVDEIDLHLHPLWQARILGDLRTIFPNVQFIVTTHAPVVISSVNARHIRVLDGGEEARRLSGEIYGSDADRVLMSVMGAPERPADVQEKLDKFYCVLDEGDFEGARELLSDLESLVGSDDTALVAARTALSLEEAEARYAAD